MERKLSQCACCKEWFNTTSFIMTQHYKLKHEFYANKVIAIAELTLKKEICKFKLHFAEFPENFSLYVQTQLIDEQINRIVCATPENIIKGE